MQSIRQEEVMPAVSHCVLRRARGAAAALMLMMMSFALSCTAAAAAAPLRMAINEGVTAQVTVAELLERYRPLADMIATTLSRQVNLEVYTDTPSFRKVLDKDEPDVVFGKTVNVLARAIRERRYRAVVKMDQPYVAGFIVAKDSPIRTPQDLRGKTIMLPEGVFTTKLGLATLRDLQLDKQVEVRYTRLQEVVAYTVDTGLADAGVVNPTIKKKWQADGKPVLLETKPVPNWSVIATARMSERDATRLANALVALDRSPKGQEALKAIGVVQFVPANAEEYSELLRYILE
jgi:ABC-type phosphate/phosphonate transport system substrate-binding protein